MRELLGLADKLSKAYGWKEGDALWFVLTGYIPPIRPLEVEMFINTSSSWPSGRDPFMARITVTAHAWIQADEVKRAFHDAQRQLLRGDAPRPRREQTLEVVKFVARRIGRTPRRRGKTAGRHGTVRAAKTGATEAITGSAKRTCGSRRTTFPESTTIRTTRNAREHLMKRIAINGTTGSLEERADRRGNFGTPTTPLVHH